MTELQRQRNLIETIVNLHKNLGSLNPEDNLLMYIKVNEKGFIITRDPLINEKFHQEYGDGNFCELWGNYASALEARVKELNQR